MLGAPDIAFPRINNIDHYRQLVVTYASVARRLKAGSSILRDLVDKIGFLQVVINHVNVSEGRPTNTRCTFEFSSRS